MNSENNDGESEAEILERLNSDLIGLPLFDANENDKKLALTADEALSEYGCKFKIEKTIKSTAFVYFQAIARAIVYIRTGVTPDKAVMLVYRLVAHFAPKPDKHQREALHYVKKAYKNFNYLGNLYYEPATKLEIQDFSAMALRFAAQTENERQSQKLIWASEQLEKLVNGKSDEADLADSEESSAQDGSRPMC